MKTDNLKLLVYIAIVPWLGDRRSICYYALKKTECNYLRQHYKCKNTH